MTIAEKRFAIYKTLIANIRSDWETCQVHIDSIMELVQEIAKSQKPTRGSDVMAVAAYLHHFYTGVEAIFNRISIIFDGRQAIDEDYQQELLRSMTLEIPDVRPPIITKELWEELDEFRRFREIFRHAEGAMFYSLNVNALASRVELLKDSLAKQIENFIEFAEDLTNNIDSR